MKYGLLAGFGMSLWMLAEYFLGLQTRHLEIGAYADWGTEVILLIMVWLFLRHKMAVLTRYWYPVWEGALHGAMACLVAGLVFCTFLNFHLRFINPDWPYHYRMWRATAMRAAGESEEAVRIFSDSFDWSVTPLGLAVYSIGVYTVLGALAASVLTLWLNWRRKEPVDPR
jgi:hypothetical protein